MHSSAAKPVSLSEPIMKRLCMRSLRLASLRLTLAAPILEDTKTSVSPCAEEH